MAKAILHLLLNAGVFLLLARSHVLHDFDVSGWPAAILASLVLGLVNATLGLFLKILTFPLILLTFGLFTFVVNAIVILVVAALVPGVGINSFWPALIAAVIISAVNLVWKLATSAPREVRE